MFIVNENEKEYRFGDSGPKYLMKGPRMNFALVQFGPGQDFKAHYPQRDGGKLLHSGGRDRHRGGRQGEPFEGGRPHPYRAGRGALLHQQLERKNKNGVHLTPYQEVDKVEVDNYTYENKLHRRPRITRRNVL